MIVSSYFIDISQGESCSMFEVDEMCTSERVTVRVKKLEERI